MNGSELVSIDSSIEAAGSSYLKCVEVFTTCSYLRTQFVLISIQG